MEIQLLLFDCNGRLMTIDMLDVLLFFVVMQLTISAKMGVCTIRKPQTLISLKAENRERLILIDHLA